MGVRNLEVNVDSKLVANQVNGTYIAKEADMIKYLEKVRTLTSTFRAFSIKQVPRSKNKKADALSKIGGPTILHISANRTAEVDIAENDEALEINLDLIEEKREQAAIREAKSKRQMEKYYNTKVRNTSFKTSETYCIQGGNEQPCRNPGKKKFGT
ncbi:reverse transcriptase domain-containing protein [Tanacetum coccineum]